MKIFPASTVRDIDQYTIENEPINSIDLMERASLRIVNWYVRRYRTHRRIVVIAGPGNNGGDALAIARMLSERQYKVVCYFMEGSGKVSEDCKKNLDRIESAELLNICYIKDSEDFPKLEESDVIIEGLFGSGLTRVIEGFYKDLIQLINSAKSEVISIDIPSGLFGEDNSQNEDSAIVRANITLTFQFPFLSFFFAENERYTGTWKVLQIELHPIIIANTPCNYNTIERLSVADCLPPRKKFSHKGNFGHALIIGGSYGMMGAALLCGEAVLRSGAGLVTLHVPEQGYAIVQSSIPEAIVSIDHDEFVFTQAPDIGKYSVVCIGPGLGSDEKTVKAIRKVLEIVKVPLVIDADALNIISENKNLIKEIPEFSILTPHPIEFDRLVGKSENGWDRHIKQIDFSKKYNLIIVLKGAYTGISFPDGSYLFNTSGNPGMATGGSGDVLSGIIVSLLSQGMSAKDASIAGVFMHGLAGDIASERFGQESMIASDITKCLGEAYTIVKAKPYLHEGRIGGLTQ